MKKSFLTILFAAVVLSACNEKVQYKSYNEYPVYEGTDLGLTYSPQNCKFRTWAPNADKVKLLLYDKANEGGAYQTHDMSPAEQGSWTLQIDDNLKGKYFTFQIKIGEKWMEETPGLFVKATGPNGKRAAIVDLAESDPAGWASDTRPHMDDLGSMIVYQTQLREFSNAASSGIKHKGKFIAFTEHGTHTAAGDVTGIDYLKELGVTHVQLMPLADFGALDETRPQEYKYVQGYDVANFDVPEGSYATDVKNPLTRIREFKEMVMALHQAGIRINMEVVYNHTAKGKSSHLDLLAPGYFYRQRADSTWADSFGFGNELATERGMMRHLIVESVKYWASEMHVDGFCFSGMGAMDVETMNEIRAELDKIDPTICMYGDGRSAGKSPLPVKKRAEWEHAAQMNNVGVFAYNLKDVLLGTGKPENSAGFIGGTDSLEQSLNFALTGGVGCDSIDYKQVLYCKKPYASSPAQAVHFMSNHDELTLTDKIRQIADLSGSEEAQQRAARLAWTVMFTSQGVPCVNGGDEIQRTKKGLAHTEQLGDSINSINWASKSLHTDYLDYIKGLISMRKAHKAFRIVDKELFHKQIQLLSFERPNVVGFVLKDHANGDEWKDILVLYNGSRWPVSVQIPEGSWTVVCKDGQINQNGLGQSSGGWYSIAGSSATVMYQ